MSNTRTERDSMGPVEVPAEAYYAAQTQRAVENFQISGTTLPDGLVRAMGLVKFACATANRDLGKLTGSGKNPLTDEAVDALLKACREVADGGFRAAGADQFPIDIYQTGSGTSSNMNVNEVIAARATEMLGGDRFAAEKAVHPNDHVNMGQSTNDTFPTAIHVAVASAITGELNPTLMTLSEALDAKAKAWDDIIKIGRTHLADATPLRLGQEFGGFARQAELAANRSASAADEVLELPVGGMGKAAR
ncbi:MAG: lyase family protein, partial [Planctomycetota bacterium]